MHARNVAAVQRQCASVCCGVRRKMTNQCGEFICRSGIRGFICVGASDSSRVAVAECRERLWCDTSRSLRRFGSSALSLRCSFARRMFDMQVASNAGGDAAAKGVHCACSVWSCSPKGGGSLSIFFFFRRAGLCALTGASCHYGRREAMSRAYFATGLFAADAILLRLFERCFAKWQQCHQREHPRVARAGSLSDAFAKLTAMSQMRASMHTFVLENAFSYYTAVPERSLMLFRIH